MLNFRLKFRIRLYIRRFQPFVHFKKELLNSSQRKAYVFLAADYGNLGDIAITYAQEKFLCDNSDYQVVEVPISQSIEGLWFVKKNIKSSDIVTIIGGGNMGDLYDQIEYIRQLTIHFFPNNKIISFPQTFDFSETSNGRKTLAKAVKVYNRHNNIHIFAREKTSYELMLQKYTKATISLVPDIVLSLDKSEPQWNRTGVVICMRNDAEKSLTREQNEYIIDTAKKHFDEISYYDTHIGRNNLSIYERKEELNKIWLAFRGAELVITDRLHGMIFSYITKTPCLVFSNNNHKIKESYVWIGNSGAITLISEFTEESVYDYFEKKIFNNNFVHLSLREKYQTLIDAIRL